MTKEEPRLTCPLCGRHVLLRNMSDHHVVPRSRGGKEKALLCFACHRKVHSLFTNRELEAEYHSVEKLKSHPQMQSFISWLSRRSPEYLPRSRQANERRRRR